MTTARPGEDGLSPGSVRLGPGGLAASSAARDLFPLPRPARPAAPPRCHSRMRRRWEARDSTLSLVDNAVQSLNWLRGYPVEMSTESAPEPMQLATLDRLHGLAVDEQRDPDEERQPARVAGSQLMRGRAVYSADAVNDNLAPYAAGLISLPDDISDAPMIENLVGEDCQMFLQREGERMRRPASEVSADPLFTELKAYSDPGLVRHRRHYAEFVRDLKRRHMVAFTRYPAESCGVFFVYKKCKKLRRLIIAARRCNLHFHRPPHVSLVSGEGLSCM